MSRYDDEYDDNEDERDDEDEIDGEDGVRRSTANPFSSANNRPNSVRGAGLPQNQNRPPNNADGSVPSPIRSGGMSGSGSGSGNSLFPNQNRSNTPQGNTGANSPNRPNSPQSGGNSLYPNQNRPNTPQSGGGSGSSGNSPSGVQPYSRSAMTRSPGDERKDDDRNAAPNRMLGNLGQKLGGDKPAEKPSGGSFGSRIGGGGNSNDNRQQDERASRLTGGLGGLTSRIGGGDDKKDNASGGGLGGLTSRFGGGDKKDNSSGGGLGGLTSRFGGGGDKKDNKPQNANKPGGGGLGGLTSRFGGGGKKDDKKDNKPGGLAGGLGGLTSRFGGGDKKDDKAQDFRSSGGLGSSSSSSSMGGLGGNRPGQPQSPLGANRPGQTSSSFGGAGSSSSSLGGLGSRTPAGTGIGGSKVGGAKKPGVSLSERLKAINPFAKQDARTASAKSRASKAPRVDQGGLSLDNKLDILGVSLLLGSLVLLLSSLSPTKGALTESINHGFSFLFGWGAVAVLLVIFAVGVWLILRHFGDEAPVISRTRLIGLGMLFLGVMVAAQYIDSFQYKVGANQDYLGTVKTVFLPIAYNLGRGGGWIGGEIYFQLLSNFGEIGGFMVLIGWLLVGVMLALSLSASDMAVVVISNARNLGDVARQRSQRAAAQRAAKQQSLGQALAAQQISVSKPLEALPTALTSPALPAPSFETLQQQDQRRIAITTAGRTSSVAFRGQNGQEQELSETGLPLELDQPIPATALGKAGLFGGLGSRVRAALPVGRDAEDKAPVEKAASDKTPGSFLPFGKKSGDKPREDQSAAEKAAGLRGRLFSRETTIAGGESLALDRPVTVGDRLGSVTAAETSLASSRSLLNNDSLASGLKADATAPANSTIPEITQTVPPAMNARERAIARAAANAAPGATASQEQPAASVAAPEAAQKPAEATPRLGDLLGRFTGSSNNTTPANGSGQTTAPGVQPYQRPPLSRPEPPTRTNLNGETKPAEAPAARLETPIPDLQTRLRTLRDTAEAPKPEQHAEAPAARSTASPAFGKPADPPFAVTQRATLSPDVLPPKRPPRHWQKPDSADLLSTGVDQEPDHDLLLKRAHLIEETLASFGAPGRVVDVRTGPVVTQFGVEPDYVEGRGGKKNRVKVGAIAALDKDLQLALGAKAIRIEAPVPGKGYVGIEVPNAKAEVVHLRDVLESPEFKKIKSPLAIALGQGVDGTPVTADLASMPHLLIAGTTGSGKSVCVNTVIASILLNNSPKAVKFVMVDPKRVELTQYNGIPHLIAPVVVDLERIVSVLKWVTREMDERYRKFSNAAARNIEDFNKHLPQTEEIMPYIVVIIDELADLMMLAPDDTERVITRIAALARATGIHLVIATQRPSVDVVTGLIKANFPARIAFAVAGNTDSRVILDQPGAERLLGRGDMLYMSGDAPAPVRLQGVFVSDNEIGNITRFWRGQMTDQDLIEASRPIGGSIASDSSRSEGGGVIMKNRDGSSSGKPQVAFWDRDDEDGDDIEDEDELADGEDAMYEEAVDLVRRLNKASVSLLQRRLRIGYTRAARMIDTMEERGVVGPATEGSKPRDVLPVR